MNISSAFDRLHALAKRNGWLWLFSIFCRLSLAAGFLSAGLVKIVGERFASGLSANHPMGHYLEALHTTGFYYTFIGVAQVAAAIFLLIPRTVTLGAFIYFPIILNITVLTYATRFEGSIFTSPLMTLASLFLLGWNYEKWKYILPFNRLENAAETQEIFAGDLQTTAGAGASSGFSRYGFRSLAARLRVFLNGLRRDKFPLKFFAGVFAAIVFFVVIVPNFYSVKPRNTLPQCLRQFNNTNRARAGAEFCGCIHQRGEPLDKCLGDFNSAGDDAAAAP